MLLLVLAVDREERVTVFGGASQPHGKPVGLSMMLAVDEMAVPPAIKILVRGETAAGLRLIHVIGQDVLLRDIPVRHDLRGIDVLVRMQARDLRLITRNWDRDRTRPSDPPS